MIFRDTSGTQRNRRWLWAGVLALLLQSLYPTGTMPGNLADGWFASLCPDGLPENFLHSTGHHSHHEHHTSVTKPISGDCQLGNALEQPLELSTAFSAPEHHTPDGFSQLRRLLNASSSTIRVHHARAPPAA